jgi:hypothetical protein
MSDSNSDEGPIGMKRLPQLSGVKVSKSVSKFAAAPKSFVAGGAPKPKPFMGVPKSLAEAVKVVEAPLDSAEAVEVVKAVEPVEVGKAVEAVEANEEAPALSISELAGSKAGPAVDHMLTRDEFLGAGLKDHIKDLIQAKPVDVTPPAYMPVSSTKFPNFMVQTYLQYSLYLQRILKEMATGKSKDDAEAAVIAEKALDEDACKRRDPNKVETFYYQKLVRDYLQKNSPYRGLLVYHGLGSGKTCTSIAAAEALYWGGQKKIYILTPATLSSNYKRELGKCGYFPLRTNNHWSFLAAQPGSIEFAWLENILGLPQPYIMKFRGGWVPEPDKPSNWDELSAAERDTILFQQTAHLEHRFTFMNYNGRPTPVTLSQMAQAAANAGRTLFDDAVVVIDEIHNLVRTINGTEVGRQPLHKIIDSPDVEPREPTWSMALRKKTPGYIYPRGYSYYRLLQNAVGAKIIALSATPMINYPQELSILLNIIGGEQRVVEIPLKGMAADKLPRPGTSAYSSPIEQWALRNPTIDFFTIEQNQRKDMVLTVTPVPYGFSKVVDATGPRGFFRDPSAPVVPVEESRERRMNEWAVTLLQDLEKPANGFFAGDRGELSSAAAAAAVETRVLTRAFTVHTFPMLPENPKVFVENFIDVNTLAIKHKNVLKARASGLISYYRGGGDELMPRVTKNEKVLVPMSDFSFRGYTVARQKELDIDSGMPEKPAQEEGEQKQKKRKGMTVAEMDLYTQAIKSPDSGFLALSRAACNWVFPTEVPRPVVSAEKQKRLLGIEQKRIIAANMASPEPDDGLPEGGGGGGGGPAPEEAPEEGTEVMGTVLEAQDPETKEIVGGLMAKLEEKGEQYLNRDVATYSPKYAAMLANMRTSPGPVLVYSNFKTLEGLGIFASALRFSAERYMQLDLVKAGGSWEIPAEIMKPEHRGRPRFVIYSGDQDLDKRRLLLQLYNADVRGLPPRLSAQCQELLGDATDNRDGRICRAFMITQSGAEGISLFNTRQVHVMEPYWNNVRIQQVIGRAIRLCSHMNLPWADRTVDIFTYLTVFTDTQKLEAKPIMAADKSMTTDEMIFSIASKKQLLADGLFEIAQTAAVDCELHYHEHGKAVQCFKFAEQGRPLFMYHPDWRKDVQSSADIREAGGP